MPHIKEASAIVRKTQRHIGDIDGTDGEIQRERAVTTPDSKPAVPPKSQAPNIPVAKAPATAQRGGAVKRAANSF